MMYNDVYIKSPCFWVCGSVGECQAGPAALLQLAHTRWVKQPVSVSNFLWSPTCSRNPNASLGPLTFYYTREKSAALLKPTISSEE